MSYNGSSGASWRKYERELYLDRWHKLAKKEKAPKWRQKVFHNQAWSKGFFFFKCSGLGTEFIGSVVPRVIQRNEYLPRISMLGFQMHLIRNKFTSQKWFSSLCPKVSFRYLTVLCTETFFRMNFIRNRISIATTMIQSGINNSRYLQC